MSNMLTDVKAAARAQTGLGPYGSTKKNQHEWDHLTGTSDEELPLIEAGDKDNNIEDIQCDHELACEYVFPESIDEHDQAAEFIRASEAAAQCEIEDEFGYEQLAEDCMWNKGLFQPFFKYRWEIAEKKHTATSRSEVYETACSLGGRMRHINPNKHPQFYGNLRID